MDFNDKLKKSVNSKLKDEVAFLLMEDSVSDVKIFVPTGCTELDYRIRNAPNGGIPIGKITEITGHEATGKSLMAMQIMANAQKMGGLAIYIDSEQGLNTDFAMRVGLDVHKNFIHIATASVEDVFTIMYEISEALSQEEQEAKKEKREPEHKFVVVVWDSIAATNPKTDIESENPDPQATVGLKARILGKNLPLILQGAWKQKIGFVFINQLRLNIKAMPGQDPYVSPGGKAVAFYSSVRIRLQSIGKLKDPADDSIYGIKTKAKILKTRFGPPFRQAEFPIYFNYGIDDEESITNVLISSGHIEKRNAGRLGSLYSFKNEPKDSGMKLLEFKNKLRSDPEFRKIADNYLEEALVKDMIDPRNIELSIITDEQLSK